MSIKRTHQNCITSPISKGEERYASGIEGIREETMDECHCRCISQQSSSKSRGVWNPTRSSRIVSIIDEGKRNKYNPKDRIHGCADQKEGDDKAPESSASTATNSRRSQKNEALQTECCNYSICDTHHKDACKVCSLIEEGERWEVRSPA
jgi:hypothetical protein